MKYEVFQTLTRRIFVDADCEEEAREQAFSHDDDDWEVVDFSQPNVYSEDD